MKFKFDTLNMKRLKKYPKLFCFKLFNNKLNIFNMIKLQFDLWIQILQFALAQLNCILSYFNIISKNQTKGWKQTT